MVNKNQTKALFALVIFAVVLLGYGPLWAESATPNFTETIIDGNTKVVSNSDGTVTVYFLDEDCIPTATDDCWGEPAEPQQGVICICPGGGADCEIDTAECYPIKQAGAGTTGCLVSKNPRTYLFGGDAYTRP